MGTVTLNILFITNRIKQLEMFIMDTILLNRCWNQLRTIKNGNKLVFLIYEEEILGFIQFIDKNLINKYS